MSNELLKILEAREQRWQMRKQLAEKHHSCLVTVTPCVPAAFRTDEEFCKIFFKLCTAFFDNLADKGCRPNFEGYMQSDDGPAFFITTGTDAREVKRLCVEAEETTLGGRILDIDVMDRDGTPIDRGDIGLLPRKCFICENPAALCVSRRLHSASDISEHVKQMIEQITKDDFIRNRLNN